MTDRERAEARLATYAAVRLALAELAGANDTETVLEDEVHDLLTRATERGACLPFVVELTRMAALMMSHLEGDVLGFHPHDVLDLAEMEELALASADADDDGAVTA